MNIIIKYSKLFIIIIILLFIFSHLLYLISKEESIENKLINKIEQFKVVSGRLPDSLVEISFKETEAGPFYNKYNANKYTIDYMTDTDQSMIYDSGTKTWQET